MAGHSKWANIKHRKEAQDAKKTKLFTKLIKEIIVATQQGGPNPESNSTLRLVIQRAKDANIPKANLLRAIQKGSGTDKQNNYQKITYEAYAPHGIAFLVETITDNNKRTVAMLRALLNRHGGKLEKNGALKHLFRYLGTLKIENINPQLWEKAYLELIEAGVTDIEESGTSIYCMTEPVDFASVQKRLESLQIFPIEASLTYKPTSPLHLDEPKARQVMRLLEAIEQLEDVERLFHNLILPSEVAAS